MRPSSLAVVLILAATSIVRANPAPADTCDGAPVSGQYCESPNLPIPDNDNNGVTTSLTIAGSGVTITDLRIGLQIQHTWPGDVRVLLSKVGGPTVEVFDDFSAVFGCPVNDIVVTMQDNPALPDDNDCQGTQVLGFCGDLTPDQGGGISNLDGESLDGTWELTVIDKVATDIGTLETWCLSEGPADPFEPPPGDGECDAPEDYPDLIISDLHQIARSGETGGITAFSVGTISCNIGTCRAEWRGDPSNRHPVIGQGMFRLKDGRFEQIGQSWVRHTDFALSLDQCSDMCICSDPRFLGVQCSEPDSAAANGYRNDLGPKFEINPTSGVHPHPFTAGIVTDFDIDELLQVHDVDLDPAMNENAQYFVEGQLVARDDAIAGRLDNNASYRPIEIIPVFNEFDALVAGVTLPEQPVIYAWAAADPAVVVSEIDVPGDGRFLVASKASPSAGSGWRYEYAVQNLNSHRAAMSFSVPVEPGREITNVGFHDVDYHSGEPFAGTDWAHNGGEGGLLTWTTGATHDDNPNANALRWGTLYNFRFDVNVAPGLGSATLEMYRTGTPDSVDGSVYVPVLCNDDGVCDFGETCSLCASDCLDSVCEAVESGCSCPEDCGLPTEIELACSDGLDDDCDLFVDCDDPDCCFATACVTDLDGDSVISCVDCDDGDAGVWASPGAASGLTLTAGSLLRWDPPAEPGGDVVVYAVLRARTTDDFLRNTDCLSADPTVPLAVDTSVPTPGQIFAYLVRVENECPDAVGNLGAASSGEPRVGRSCP